MTIQRDRYLNELISAMWNGQVKVVTGIRRCGKSYLLTTLFRQHLMDTGVPPNNVIFIDLDQTRFIGERNPLNLAAYVRKRITDKSQKFYLFIDEIQNCEAMKNPAVPDGRPITFYDALNELRTYENLDVYVTGSNSKMLSTDILTEFRGRGHEIRIHPLNFSEYLAAVGGDRRDALDDYLVFGGMPYAVGIASPAEKMKYLKNLFAEVYIKDIVERKHVTREEVLDAALDLLSSAIGSLTNPHNIANVLTTKLGITTNTNTVRTYVEHLKDAFLFSEARRYDVRGKAYFDYPNKYYAEDLGLRNARTGFREIDQPHLMENAIYNELVLRGYSVDIGVVQTCGKDKKGRSTRTTHEIDFVVNKGDERIYVQSAYRMDEEDKKERELRPLFLTGDAFRRVVIRQDVGRRFHDERGVLHISLADFLLDSESI